MRDRLLTFIDALRDAGLPLTMAEALDAMHAVGVIGVEPEAFHEGLAAALVKDEADRPAFDAVFARFFAVPGRQRRRGERPQPVDEGQGRGSGRPGTLPAAAEHRERPRDDPGQQPSSERCVEFSRRRQQPDGARRLARDRELLTIPFRTMSPPDAEACEALVTELAQRFRAHLSRRQHAAHRGRLDLRRTLRRSITKGGVPIDPAFRRRRPGRPDLVALCDFSHSVTIASQFLIALLTPASAFFRRVRLFAFVDRPVEVSFEGGALVPHEPLDLYARSDFGKVLLTFWNQHEPLLTRSTIILILGDARNNRRPPRADVLGRIHSAVRQTTWLNPEPRERWNTGDSTMGTYERHCDALLAASNVRELYAALRRTFRTL
ncbi:MAG: VWA domain-containing protein [Candidatus Binatia bacterium]